MDKARAWLEQSHLIIWGKTPGNSPELMPLDTSLYQDIHESTKKHKLLSMALCTHHSAADNCIFLMATPREAARCYKHICLPITGVEPTSECILQDVNKAINALQVIYKAEGVYILGLADGRTAGRGYLLVGQGPHRDPISSTPKWPLK